MRLVGEDGLHFGRELIADAGLDEDGFVMGADDGAVGAEEDAVLVVDGGTLLPEGLGDDAEHGTAVEAEGAVGAMEDF